MSPLSDGNPLRNYLDNLYLKVLVATYSRVPHDWQRKNELAEFCRMYFITEGSGWVKVGKREFTPQSGQMVILPAGSNISFSTIAGERFSKYWCHFTATVGEMNLFKLVALPVVIDIHDKSRVISLFQKLISHYNSHEVTSVLSVQSVMLELLVYYLSQTRICDIQEGSIPSAHKMNSVISYIEQHLAEDLSVEQLAGLAHFHPNYFIRMFKTLFGMPPIHYVNRMRMESAKHLLLTTNRSVSSIAEEIGLQLYYFSRVFKKHSGFTPSEFRGLVRVEK